MLLQGASASSLAGKAQTMRLNQPHVSCWGGGGGAPVWAPAGPTGNATSLPSSGSDAKCCLTLKWAEMSRVSRSGPSMCHLHPHGDACLPALPWLLTQISEVSAVRYRCWRRGCVWPPPPLDPALASKPWSILVCVPLKRHSLRIVTNVWRAC